MKLLTVDEVANRLALSAVTLRRLVRRGDLTPVRPTGSRALRFMEDDIDAFVSRIREQQAGGGGAA